ncbi:MAG TPA: nucleotide disphospho-sugar-binding domain-containing protein [Solirubrobacteraceae bacterium]|nr:nucleotide disphospho-sugar-binding domain-containing protein [Solirubrobacteraceae bacterium]
MSAPGGPGRRLRVFLGAFGEPGHAFPMLGLGAELAARGHEVTYETWSRWREHVEAAGMRFVSAPENKLFPLPGEPFEMYEAVVRATGPTRRSVASVAPDVVVHDILTLAPAMAGELEGVPVATLIPHLYPVSGPGFPPYALGARLPRTAAGRAFWTSLDRPSQAGLRRGRSELNEARRRLGLPQVDRLHGGLSEHLCMVGTFPQLEYPRSWPAGVHVVGPLTWEMPFGDVDPPDGDAPLVLVAPSTAQDPSHRLLRAALGGLGGEPIRVLATWNRRPVADPVSVPPNMRLVEWVSYTKTMPSCSLVISHAGHGTMARSLACGCPVLAVPHVGDMAENAARADWAGVGARLPWRLLGPTTLRLAVRRALASRSLAARAGELAAWAAGHDGAARAADLVEELARRPGQPVASPEARARMNSISSGASPSARSIGSPEQLHSSTTARWSDNSTARQIAP